MHAVVRSEEQMHALSKLDANIIKLDLSDGPAVTSAIDDNQSMCGNCLFAKQGADTRQLISSSIQPVRLTKYLFPIYYKRLDDAELLQRRLFTSFT